MSDLILRPAEIMQITKLREIDLGHGDYSALYDVSLVCDSDNRTVKVSAPFNYGNKIEGVLSLPEPVTIIQAMQLCMAEVTGCAVDNRNALWLMKSIATLKVEDLPKVVLFGMHNESTPVFRSAPPQTMFTYWQHKYVPAFQMS